MKDLKRYLREDLGNRGDITSEAVLGREKAVAKIFAKQDCVVAGLDEARSVFESMNLEVRKFTDDGSHVKRGDEVLEVSGDAKKILAAERTALNFVMKMSGVATVTSVVVEKCRPLNHNIDIAATRKTTPGFRYFEKKAVILGGGSPHRLGLYDSILIKDNHLMLVGSISEAIRRAREKSKGQIIEVETRTAKDAELAVRAGADVIMLDNFKPGDIPATVKKLRGIKKDVLIEISGGITPDNICQYAKYADIISLGALTHSYSSMDFALKVVKKC
jgi:nicotinate-nucleotide pyrophosphorylase (carboxylating)